MQIRMEWNKKAEKGFQKWWKFRSQIAHTSVPVKCKLNLLIYFHTFAIRRRFSIDDQTLVM